MIGATDYEVTEFTAHDHEGLAWYSAQVVAGANRLFVDNRWGTWTVYAVQPVEDENRPEPGQRGHRRECALHLARVLSKRVPRGHG